jgi:hypothetical protein
MSSAKAEAKCLSLSIATAIALYFAPPAFGAMAKRLNGDGGFTAAAEIAGVIWASLLGRARTASAASPRSRTTARAVENKRFMGFLLAAATGRHHAVEQMKVMPLYNYIRRVVNSCNGPLWVLRDFV